MSLLPKVARPWGHSSTLAAEQSLRPWTEVAAEFERRTGETLTPYWCNVICRNAERKLAPLLIDAARAAELLEAE